MDDIELGNLKSEVVVLRELVRMLVGEMPYHPDTTRKIVDAMDRARATAEKLSPARIGIDHAINSMRPHDWLRR